MRKKRNFSSFSILAQTLNWYICDKEENYICNSYFCNINIQRFFTSLEYNVSFCYISDQILLARAIVNHCFVERIEISVIFLIRYEPFFLFSILDFSVKRKCLSASRTPKWFVLIIEIYPRLRYRATTFALVCHNTILRRSVSYCSFKFSRWYNGVMWYTPFLFWQLTLSPWIIMTHLSIAIC